MDRKTEALNKAIEIAKLSDNYDVEAIIDNAEKIEKFLGEAKPSTWSGYVNTSGAIYTTTPVIGSSTSPSISVYVDPSTTSSTNASITAEAINRLAKKESKR